MALRQELKRLKQMIAEMEANLLAITENHTNLAPLWNELPQEIHIKNVVIKTENIAGVKVQVFRELEFETIAINWMQAPGWLPSGIEILKTMVSAELALMIELEKYERLEKARKKTTQKVNLYEKIQIPAYQDAIVKIKRFMEDRENIQKAAQKMMKERKREAEVL